MSFFLEISGILTNESFPIKTKDDGNCRRLFGGDKRDRTADLLTASQALSQLSYTPKPVVPRSEHLIV